MRSKAIDGGVTKESKRYFDNQMEKGSFKKLFYGRDVTLIREQVV